MTLEGLRTQYQDDSSRAERLRDVMVVQLSELLAANDITLGVPIESRVKSWTSIEEKLLRKSVEIKNVVELHDLVGVRLIVLFRSDLTRALSLVSENFEVISLEDTADRLGESEFGYQSQHFVLRLPASWLSVPSLAGLSGLFVELQVRTLAQHIWAAASHKLQYKHEAGVPPPLRRTINRVSALLETVDLEFERVLQERKEYVEQTKRAPVKNEQLNVDSLAAILSEIFPPESKSDNEPYANLLANLSALQVHTPKHLRDIIIRNMDAVRESEAKEVKERRLAPSTDADSPRSERLTRGVFFAHVGLAREALRKEFGDEKVNDVMRSKGKTERAGQQTKQGAKKGGRG